MTTLDVGKYGSNLLKMERKFGMFSVQVLGKRSLGKAAMREKGVKTQKWRKCWYVFLRTIFVTTEFGSPDLCSVIGVFLVGGI